MPTVSVVVTCYNYGRYLPEALDSVLAQTFTDFEVILIDDGSTDETPDVAVRYVLESGIRYYRQDNSGPAAARNAGIERSKAPWVAFLDADDIWSPEKLESQLAAVEGKKTVGVVYTDRFWTDPAGRPLSKREHRKLPSGFILPNLFLDNFICLSSSMVRRECFARDGNLDTRLIYGDDYDLWLRIARDYEFLCVHERLVRYRKGYPSLSQPRRQWFQNALFILTRFLQDYGGRRMLSRRLIRNAFARRYANYAYTIRSKQPGEAIKLYATSLAYYLGHWTAWKGLVRAIGYLVINPLTHNFREA